MPTRPTPQIVPIRWFVPNMDGTPELQWWDGNGWIVVPTFTRYTAEQYAEYEEELARIAHGNY